MEKGGIKEGEAPFPPLVRWETGKRQRKQRRGKRKGGMGRDHGWKDAETSTKSTKSRLNFRTISPSPVDPSRQ